MDYGPAWDGSGHNRDRTDTIQLPLSSHFYRVVFTNGASVARFAKSSVPLGPLSVFRAELAPEDLVSADRPA